MSNSLAPKAGSPDLWREVQLGEIAEFVMGQAPPGSECNKCGEGTPFVKAGEFGAARPIIREWTTKPLKMARRGDVLICVVGATCGKLNLGEDCAIGRSVAAIRPATGVSSEFIYRQLQPMVLELRSRSAGSAQGVISKADLSKIPIQLPSSSLQDRIVAKLDELFSQIEKGEENLKRVQALVKQYRRSVLKAGVTGELTRDWREANGAGGESGEELLARILKARRAAWEAAELEKMKAKGKDPKNDKWKEKYKEPELADTSDLPELPDGWVWATVDQITVVVQYGSSSKCDDGDDGVPVLRMGNIIDGALEYDKLKYLPTEHDEFPELLLQNGDMLFNRTNSAELVGKSAVYDGRLGKCSFASYLIRVRTVLVDANWLATFINSALGRNWIESVKSQQVGQANVNGTKLKALRVPLPPHAEIENAIQRLDEELSKADAALRGVEVQLRKAVGLRQSVLHHAFSGDLVPQDPNDEPASVLLERIAAERLATAKKSPKRRAKRKANA